jgi:hypothetical protein
MANIKSQKKRNITNAKRHERNKAVKAEVKTRTKRVDGHLGTDDNDEAVKARRQAHRHRCVEGCHPQERRRPQEEPPDEEGQRRRLTTRTTRDLPGRTRAERDDPALFGFRGGLGG